MRQYLRLLLLLACLPPTAPGCAEDPGERGPRDQGPAETGPAPDHGAAPDAPVADLPPFKPGWFLVWSDDFGGSGAPDPARWSYEEGCSIRNSEAQYYTKARTENARLQGGELMIEARAEQLGACSYTSASLITKGRAHLRYGRVEVRAQLPTGKGMWPAIWMLPVESAYGGWPASGEIDIMENVGYEPQTIHMTVHTEAYNHTKNNAKSGTTKLSAPSSSFYTYAIEWRAGRIDFFVDKTKHFTYDRPSGADWTSWPFDKPFYLLLNVAVGGSWGGSQGIDTAIFPQRMRVDSVKLYTWIDDPGPHTLQVKAGPGGAVKASPAGPQHRAGTSVTLTATPAPGYQFARWSGVEVGMLENPLRHTVTADRTIQASFAKQGELIENGDFAAGKLGWSLNTQGGAQAALQVSGGEAGVAITSGGSEVWHVQLLQGGLALAQGKSYRLSFRARAAAARSITAGVGLSASPWTSHGSKVVSLGTSMQGFTVDVKPAKADPSARVTFDLGQSSADVTLDDISLAPL